MQHRIEIYLPVMQQQPQLKRRKSEDEVGLAVPKPAASLSFIQDELADKFKLAQTREFHIQGSSKGKVLACGVEVRKLPDSSRFRIRLYDSDRNTAGKSRIFITLSMDDFLRIKRYESDIKHCLHYGPKNREKESIFRPEYHDSISVSVVSSRHAGARPVVEFSKGSRIYMNEETFDKLMYHEETLKKEYDACEKRNEEDKQFLNDLANIMSFKRNEDRENDRVKKPTEWFQAGTVTTWNKFREQVSKSKDRVRKKARTSDKTSR